MSDRQDDERRWRQVTGTVHLLSVIPLPLMSVLTLPTSFLCSLSLLSRSLRLEVRFSLHSFRDRRERMERVGTEGNKTRDVGERGGNPPDEGSE